MSEEKSRDPFAEFAPNPSAASSGQAAAAICGGVVFGAVVGAICAYFWSLDYLIAGGVGGAIGALAGWLSAPAKG
jgi:hypothetical protein